MDQFPKRKSPRAYFHNYSKGIFFVTICTDDKRHYFGKIVDGNMMYTPIGTYTLTQLQEISRHYPYAEVFEMVVMPNHIHFLIEIFDKDQRTKGSSSDQSLNKRTHGPCGEQSNGDQRTHGPCREQSIGDQRTHEPCVPTERTALSVVIGGFKRDITLYARRNNIKFAWQSRYHDHIIRGINDFNRIGEYIRNNIGKWEEDCFFKI